MEPASPPNQRNCTVDTKWIVFKDTFYSNIYHRRHYSPLALRRANWAKLAARVTAGGAAVVVVGLSVADVVAAVSSSLPVIRFEKIFQNTRTIRTRTSIQNMHKKPVSYTHLTLPTKRIV
eukprot:TRINITY_DN51870_c0_g1_i1.p1 TRINITY_DN51870_c0_g1~~TRINITY_DN51870_c0_g1_i1.p1  ORF type:complete len:120 (-),score=8.12 TRINITY_DN51870_c0_g1_i1:159-518(-)